jgi:hypothetical protein
VIGGVGLVQHLGSDGLEFTVRVTWNRDQAEQCLPMIRQLQGEERVQLALSTMSDVFSVGVVLTRLQVWQTPEDVDGIEAELGLWEQPEPTDDGGDDDIGSAVDEDLVADGHELASALTGRVLSALPVGGDDLDLPSFDSLATPAREVLRTDGDGGHE